LKTSTSERLGAKAAEGEVDRRPLRERNSVVSVGELPEHPAGEHLLEPPVDDPAREPCVDVTTERAVGLALLHDPLDDRERLPDLLHLILELRAAGDLPHHHRDEGGIVAPGAQQDLRNALELLWRRLICGFDGTEAPDELAPVLDEDRAQDVVLRREVVVEQAVRDAGILCDVADARSVGAGGVLVTDLPVGEDPGVEAAIRASGLDRIPLVAPTTTEATGS